MHNSGRSMQGSSSHRLTEQAADSAHPAERNEHVPSAAVTPIDDEVASDLEDLQDVYAGPVAYLSARTAAISPPVVPQQASLLSPRTQDVAGPSTYRDRRQAQDISVASLSPLVDIGLDLYLSYKGDGEYFSPDLDKTFESATASPKTPKVTFVHTGQHALSADSEQQTGRTSSRTVTPSSSPTTSRTGRRPGLAQYGSYHSARESRVYNVDNHFYTPPVSPGSTSQTRTSRTSPGPQRHTSSSSQQTRRPPVTPPLQQGTAHLSFNPPVQTSAPSRSLTHSQGGVLASSTVKEAPPRVSQSSPTLDRTLPPSSKQTQRALGTPPQQVEMLPLNFNPPANLSHSTKSSARAIDAVVAPRSEPTATIVSSQPALSRPGTRRPRPSISRPMPVASQSTGSQPHQAYTPPPPLSHPTSLAKDVAPMQTEAPSASIGALRRIGSKAVLSAQSARASIDDLRSNLRSNSSRTSSETPRISEEVPDQAYRSRFSPRRLRSRGAGASLLPLPEHVVISRGVSAEEQIDTSESDIPSPTVTRAASRAPLSNQAGPSDVAVSTPLEQTWEGYMYSHRVRSSFLPNDWQRRYFRLQGTALRVYADKHSTEPLKTYHMASNITKLVSTATEPSSRLSGIVRSMRPGEQPANAPFAFEFTSTGGRVRRFAVGSLADRENWLSRMFTAWSVSEARRETIERELRELELAQARAAEAEREEAARRRRWEREDRQEREDRKGKGRARN